MTREFVVEVTCDGPKCIKKSVRTVPLDMSWRELDFESYTDDFIEIVDKLPIFCSAICHKNWLDTKIKLLSKLKPLIA